MLIFPRYNRHQLVVANLGLFELGNDKVIVRLIGSRSSAASSFMGDIVWLVKLVSKVPNPVEVIEDVTKLHTWWGLVL